MFNTTTIRHTSALSSLHFNSVHMPAVNRVSCVWLGALDIPLPIKRWCRAREIYMDLDAYMRVRFRGRREDILKLIEIHIAPNNKELSDRVHATLTEA